MLQTTNHFNNQNFTINLPYISILVGFSISAESLNGFNELPCGTETYKAVTGGKLVPVYFWIKPGQEDVSTYDADYVKTEIASKLQLLFTEHSQINLTADEQTELVKNILRCLPHENTKLAKLTGSFHSNAGGGGVAITLNIPYGEDTVTVKVYKGDEVPPPVAPGLLTTMLQKLSGLDGVNKKHFQLKFERNGVPYAAEFEFPSPEYGTWFHPQALAGIVNQAITILLTDISFSHN